MITKEMVEEAFDFADNSPLTDPREWAETEGIEWEDIAKHVHERMMKNPLAYKDLGGINYLSGVMAGIRIGAYAARKENI